MQTDEQRNALVQETNTAAATVMRTGSPLEENRQDAPLGGTVSQAAPGLELGLPTQFAHIKPGDVVVDLGSGAGNDSFAARVETGETGRVIGLDRTPFLLDLARRQAELLGFTNVEFVPGDIDAMPLAGGLADVVISNCALNLVSDKQQAFDETYRVLKPGGHFSIADVVLIGTLPDELRQSAALHAGCVAGAVGEQVYLEIIAMAGFEDVEIQERKPVWLTDEWLSTNLTEQEQIAFRASGVRLERITVCARKPGDEIPDLSRTDDQKMTGGDPDEDDLGDLGSFDFLGRL